MSDPLMVPIRATPATPLQVAASVLKQLEKHFPGATADGARLLMAHLWLESGRGESIMNNNPGNIMSLSGEPFYEPPWVHDPRNPTHALMLQGLAPKAFRSFDTLDDGVLAYLNRIIKSPINNAVRISDPFDFARQVEMSRYCVGPGCHFDTMGQSLLTLMNSFEKAGHFSSLPRAEVLPSQAMAPKAGGAPLGALAVLGVTGFIFWGTIKKR